MTPLRRSNPSGASAGPAPLPPSGRRRGRCSAHHAAV